MSVCKKQEVVTNFNQNYNKLKFFVAKKYGEKSDLMGLFNTIELYSAVPMINDMYVDIGDESLIMHLIPTIANEKKSKSMIKNRDISFFETLPTEKFESSGLPGCKTIEPWKNIIKNPKTTKEITETIFSFFETFLTLHEIFHG